MQQGHAEDEGQFLGNLSLVGGDLDRKGDTLNVKAGFFATSSFPGGNLGKGSDSPSGNVVRQWD